MLEEPVLHNKGIPVSGYNIVHGVKLENFLQDFMTLQRIFCDPHDRCKPNAYLQADTDDLSQIPEKHNHCTGCIAQSQNKEKRTAGIIENLQVINIREPPVTGK